MTTKITKISNLMCLQNINFIIHISVWTCFVIRECIWTLKLPSQWKLLTFTFVDDIVFWHARWSSRAKCDWLYEDGWYKAPMFSISKQLWKRWPILGLISGAWSSHKHWSKGSPNNFFKFYFSSSYYICFFYTCKFVTI